ncbi:MAG TPA: CARDB domain-containing protein [Ignavibacteriaceae bacterium]|nr:CARDB domain-containing protein [Ignavibacteriaceae bacterium]
MFNFEKIGINFSNPPLYFFLFLILLAGYSFYVYRYTVPQITPAKKIFLTFLRALALILLLFVFFEPVLTLARKMTLNPVNLVFVDNSRSIQINDGMNRESTEKNFINDLNKSDLKKNSEIFTFGSKVSNLKYDSLQQLNFSEGSTNFANIFNSINGNGKNIASVVIVSDGVITEGSDPTYSAAKLGIPVFTIGIGDTTARNDIWVKNVLANDLIYAGTPTSIVATISNTGFADKNATVTLYEDGTLSSQQKIILSSDGVQNVNFTYTPKTSGEKKLTVTVSNTKGKFTFANNKKIVYVNVLSSKVKVLILAGSPSSDLSFIKNTLKSDSNLAVNSYTQISADHFIEKNFTTKIIDSTNIFFLVDFPAKNTPQDLYQKVITEIAQNDKPFFIVLSNGIDFQRLKALQSELGFTFNNINSDYLEIQPNVSAGEENNPLLQNNSDNILDAWNNLPPVYQPNVDFKAKPESEILSQIKINNSPINKPLILTRILGNKRSISVLAKDIWRWKLGTAMKKLDLFDSFILSSVKWLNAKGKNKQVTIRTTKKLYSLGENVEFTGQVYDQTFNPVSNADVTVNCNGGGGSYQIHLNSLGNGLYDGSLQTNQAGDYKYTGNASLKGTLIGSDYGSFNLGEVDIEMLNPRMDYDFLNLLANQSNGKFYYNSNYQSLFETLRNLDNASSKDKIETSEIYLWSNTWLLIVAIILFGTEWFLRKRWGLI